MSFSSFFQNLASIVISFLLLMLLVSGCSDTSGEGNEPVELLHAETYRGSAVSENPALVAVLHGDAPFNDPDYHYTLARLIAEENENVISAGLLRPGYADPDGNRSFGIRGEATGDNYTPEAIRAVAGTIQQFRESHNAGRVYIVAHSGGAAIAASLLGVAPGLVDGAVLVSCPCDVPRFREHMGGLREDVNWKALWSEPVESLSPTDLVDEVNPGTEVALIVGAEDDVTPPDLTERYADQLREKGMEPEVNILPGEGHEIFLDEAVRTAVKRLLNNEM